LHRGLLLLVLLLALLAHRPLALRLRLLLLRMDYSREQRAFCGLVCAHPHHQQLQVHSSSS
jgi:hypothetical protein